MKLKVATLALGLGVCVLGSAALAQMPRATVRAMGLETAWKSQVQMPFTGPGIVSSHLWADTSNSSKYAVVELADRTIRISEATPDRKGNPIGIEEAKERAKKKAALVLGKNDGFQVVEQAIPQIKLVLVTGNGLVQCLDAENGKLIWSTSCGLSSAPAHPGAVSSSGVSVVHGQYLYLLDLSTGKLVAQRKLREATANAVAACNDLAFVTDYAGRVQAYGLMNEARPWRYVMHGRSVGKSVSLANQTFSAIATDKGYVYVFSATGGPSVWIRYETNSPLSGSLAAGNGAFYAGSTGGVVTKISVDDRMGKIQWEYRAGRTVTAPPLIIKNNVYAATESGQLASIDDQNGAANWVNDLAGIAKPIGETQEALVCLTTTGALAMVDVETGRIESQSNPLDLGHAVVNQLNDRVYLVARNGAIQCLRSVGAELPTMFATVEMPEGAEEESGAGMNAPANVDAGTEAGSPFNFNNNAGGDPFGGAGAATDAGGDPFSGGAGGDPFGGGAGGDPFGGTGGGGDPFGGDPFGGGN